MSERDDLRRLGRELRMTLGLSEVSGSDLLAGYGPLTDEIVFGRLWARPGLCLEDRMLATLTALTSSQRLPQLKTYVGSALHIGLDARLIREVMLHAAMYSGLPTAENSLAVVAEVFDTLELTIPDGPAPEEPDLAELSALGRETMADLHDERSDAGYASPDSAAAELYTVAITHLYGDVWNRPHITRRQRMICSVAAFTATRMETQQRKFFRSALNVGLTPGEVLEVIMQTGPYSGFPPALNALTIAETVLP